MPADPHKISRRFVRLASLFGVGVAIGLSPLLGTAAVPGFKSLLSLFPIGMADTLIPTSSFLMGLAALGTYAIVQARDLSRRSISRGFRASIAGAAVFLVVLVIAYGLVVV